MILIALSHVAGALELFRSKRKQISLFKQRELRIQETTNVDCHKCTACFKDYEDLDVE